jgi:hypothetical protein
VDVLREILKDHLGRNLRGLREADRLAAAWVVVCGRALASRSEVTDFSASGAVEVSVEAGPWLEQLRSMESDLRHRLEQVAGVRVTGIHLRQKRASGSR